MVPVNMKRCVYLGFVDVSTTIPFRNKTYSATDICLWSSVRQYKNVDKYRAA